MTAEICGSSLTYKRGSPAVITTERDDYYEAARRVRVANARSRTKCILYALSVFVKLGCGIPLRNSFTKWRGCATSTAVSPGGREYQDLANARRGGYVSS